MSSVTSPCIQVCVLDPQSGFCIGCGRTGEEIGRWLDMSEAERLELMAGLADRLKGARSRAARGGRLRNRDRT